MVNIILVLANEKIFGYAHVNIMAINTWPCQNFKIGPEAPVFVYFYIPIIFREVLYAKI